MFKYKNYQTILLALLMLSGMLKSFIYAYIGQIDIVLIMSILVVGDMVISKFHASKESINTILFLALFTSYLFFSMGYSSSYEYLYDKFIGYALSLIFFIYPFFIKRFNPKIFIGVYSIILVPLTIFFIKMKSILWTETSVDTEIFMELRSNYLTLAMHLGILIIALSYYRIKIVFQLLYLGLLFATSARGPFVFVLLVLIMINFSRLKTFFLNSSAIRKLFIIIFSMSFLLYLYWDTIYVYIDTAIQRFSSVGADDKSLNTRALLMEFAFYEPFESITHFLFGSGFGSFGVDYLRSDIRAYPHNILLEIFYELGVIGVILFSAFLGLVLRRAYLDKNLFYFILIYIVLNSLKSYSLADSWVLFGVLGCVMSNFNNKNLAL